MKDWVVPMFLRLRELSQLSSVLCPLGSWCSWNWCFRLDTVLHLNKAFLLTLFQDGICFSCNLAALLTHVQCLTSDPLYGTAAQSVLPRLVFCSISYSQVLYFVFLLSEMCSVFLMPTCTPTCISVKCPLFLQLILLNSSPVVFVVQVLQLFRALHPLQS